MRDLLANWRKSDEDAPQKSMHVRTKHTALQQCSWRCALFSVMFYDFFFKVCPGKAFFAIRLVVSPRGIYYFPLSGLKHAIPTMWYLITGFRRAPALLGDYSAKRKAEVSSGAVVVICSALKSRKSNVLNHRLWAGKLPNSPDFTTPGVCSCVIALPVRVLCIPA